MAIWPSIRAERATSRDLKATGRTYAWARLRRPKARLLQLLDGSVQPTKAEEQLVLRAIANGELESEPWAPWWCDLGRLDDDIADCAAKHDALSSEALRDADAARRLFEAEKCAEQTEADAPGGEVTRARVLARSSKARLLGKQSSR